MPTHDHLLPLKLWPKELIATNISLFVLLKEPHQFTCCGQHICKICGEKLKEKASAQPCPMCRHREYGTVPDKYFERNILNKLLIWCTEGCGQEMELGQLKSHLDQCTCVKEDCPYECGQQYQRQYMKEHKDKCPKRPFVCGYCDYKSTYEVIVNEHYPVCNKYPVKCPNECSGNNEIERGKLKVHLNKCPFQLVKCEFSHVGCQEKVRRCDLSQHLSDSGLYHTAVSTKMIYESLQKLMKEKDRQIEEKERQIQEKDRLLQEKDVELKERKKSMDVVFKKLEYLECVVGNIQDMVCGDVVLSVTMTKCEYKIDSKVQWYSPPYFIHLNGYKMRFEVHFTGLLLSIYTYVMKGLMMISFNGHLKGKLLCEYLTNVVIMIIMIISLILEIMTEIVANDNRLGNCHYNHANNFMLKMLLLTNKRCVCQVKVPVLLLIN